jgi:hypothetical protein
VKAVVARAMSHHVNRGQLTRFVNLLLNGVAERPEDVTVIRYRDRLIETRHKVNSNGNQELYALGVSALRSFLRGEVRQYIRPLSDDPYPLKTNGPTATGPDLATDFLDRMALDDGRGRDGAGGPLSH